MYFGDKSIHVAKSSDGTTWTVDGSFGPVVEPRPGFWDETLVEPGPPPLLTDDWIILLYNGAEPIHSGRPDLGLRYSIGQLIFDRQDPRRVIKRSAVPLLRAVGPGRKNVRHRVCFTNGIVRHDGDWLVYIGIDDWGTGVAVGQMMPSTERALMKFGK